MYNRNPGMTEPISHRQSFFLSGRFAYSLYLLLAVVLLAEYRLSLNPDAVSYFTIALEYWHRAFPDAINGAFSPLYSWLLAPLLAMEVGGPLAARLLAIPIGAGVIFATDRLGRCLNLADDLRRAIRLAARCCRWRQLAFIVVTPDLLATWLALLLPAAGLLAEIFTQRVRSWVLGGVLGAVLYLAKAYAMWFFLGHFALIHAIWFWRITGPRVRVVASLLIGLIMFSLISAPWVAALNWKYGHFALNTTGQYNHAIERPDAPEFPPMSLGLLPPPTRMAVSVWEDASTIHLPDWNEFANGKNLRHFLLMIARNVGDCTEEFCCYSLLIPTFAVIAAILFFRRVLADAEIVLTLTALLYPLGYLLRHVEQRFISAPAIVLILLGGYLIDRASEAYALPRMHRTIAIWALCLSLLPNPIWSIVRYSGHEGLRLKNVGEYISQFVPAHANVASDSDWFTSMYASYYAQLRYYGIAKPNESADDFARDLQKQHVQYLLKWSDRPLPFLNNWQRLTPPGAQSPTMYAAAP